MSEDFYGSVSNRVFIITGAAQGFGEGIARGLAGLGGNILIADMNEEGAKEVALGIAEKYNVKTAWVRTDVSNEDSVKDMVDKAVLEFGEIDCLISCAGIVIAGGLDKMTLDKFEKVTAINYSGFFLCSKYVSKVMKEQNAKDPRRMADIIEINSKSGLEGSKANFAYAGSKFGGIGLVQSFALELAEYNIKVNAICPGNFLDGPLWSDPDKGLFKQYFESGKVSGAKSVEDVRAFYESKVPMGRGCLPEDVVLAVEYLVKQKYETGQALPVTGGQVMLN